MNYLVGINICIAMFLSIGCGQGPIEPDQLTEVTPAVFNESDLPTIELSIPGLHCEMCKRDVTELIQDTDGMADYKFDLKAKTLTIAYQSDSFDNGSLVKTLNEGGFKEASVIVEAIEVSEPALEVVDDKSSDESK